MKLERGDVFASPDGEFVRMDSPCVLSTQMDFPETGGYRLLLRLKAAPANGYPKLRLSLDGGKIRIIRPRSRRWHDCAVRLKVEAGRRRIELFFDDSVRDAETGESKAVWLDRLICVPSEPPGGFFALTEPAALCLIPRGKGIYLLDQTRWTEDKGGGSRYLSALLTNLGVEFR